MLFLPHPVDIHILIFLIKYKYSFGSGALPGKMLLVMIIENNKIDASLVRLG